MGFQMDAEMSQLQPCPQGAPQLLGEAEARTGLGHRMPIAYTCSLPGTQIFALQILTLQLPQDLSKGMDSEIHFCLPTVQ